MRFLSKLTEICYVRKLTEICYVSKLTKLVLHSDLLLAISQQYYSGTKKGHLLMLFIYVKKLHYRHPRSMTRGGGGCKFRHCLHHKYLVQIELGCVFVRICTMERYIITRKLYTMVVLFQCHVEHRQNPKAQMLFKFQVTF